MKLYAFDGVDESLELLPMAARRALDQAGRKLSLKGFLSLPIDKRRQLVEAGSGPQVDLALAAKSIADATPEAPSCDVLNDPPAESPPEEVLRAFGDERPIEPKVWQSLTHLDRYALLKVSGKGRKERVSGAYNEIIGQSSVSTHVRPQGGVHMVSISEKAVTRRQALAVCDVTMTQESFTRLRTNAGPKGDVLGTARLAGIMATKKTADLIPLCHPLALQHAEIDFEEIEASCTLRIFCKVEVEAKTGVEMEAMVGANIAALTVYDMLKSIDRGMTLGPCQLLEKSGGRSGTYRHPGAEK